MTSERSCTLKHIDTGETISLPNNTEIILGRNSFTNLTDSCLSKNQVSCTANFDRFEVSVTWLGTNMSGINGFALRKNQIYKLTHKDRIELLLKKIIYEVVFDPEPPKIEEKKDPKASVASVSTNLESSGEKKRKNGNSLMNFVQFSNKKVCMDCTWERLHDGKLHVMRTNDLIPSNKIAAFDLDGTLITTQSGRTFAKDFSDWKLLFSEIPKKLQTLKNDNFKIVIFTNQAGIGRGILILQDFKTKAEKIAAKLQVPLEMYVSTGSGLLRKPAPGMWDEFLRRNGNLTVDKECSFYVGDAAGRPANWAPKAKKDHSLADRLFARNIGLAFHTPEEFFLKHKQAEYKEPEFDPKKILHNSLTEPESEKLVSVEQEVLILVGCPASGKSFICQEYLIPGGYTWINRDTLGSQQNCLKAAESALAKKGSVVVDNTNIDAKSRKIYVEIARKFGVKVRCGVMNVSMAQSLHNNAFRELTDSSHAIIGKPIIYSFKSKFEEPNEKEGFDRIFKINFIPKFTDSKMNDLYMMYLMDK